MNGLLKSSETMTSLQIAEVTGKLHKDVPVPCTTKVTGKGQVYFVHKFMAGAEPP